jgi:chorismate--pyruvate lyase
MHAPRSGFPFMTHAPSYACEPLWQPHPRLRRGVIPQPVRGWLLDSTSLTRRLTAACGGRFRVEVDFEGWTRPMLNEAEALGLPPARNAWIRQVYLLCDERPWVFARTVIPASTLTGRERRLRHLKTRPLGAVLFADPSMQRGVVEVARLTPRDSLYPRATARLTPRPAEVWGRRSVFRLHAKPLLVSEIFLADLPPCR